MQRYSKFFSLVSLIALAALFISTSSPVQEDPAPEYIGQKKCKKCHIARHKSWKGDPHSQTFDRLNNTQKKNPECLECHSTAFGEGGFVSLEETPHLTAVQCEQCHGAGGEHGSLMTQLKNDKVDREEYPEEMKINKRPTTCIKCHSPHQEHVPME